MKVSVTIPQIFYDLIARAIPGFLFFTVLAFTVPSMFTEILDNLLVTENAMLIVFVAVAFGVLSYVMGWVLNAFTFRSASDTAKQKHKEALSEGDKSITEMYQRLRLKDEAAGFRIIKLRAEARMLESARVGMIYVFVISAGYYLLAATGVFVLSQPLTRAASLIRLCVPLILMIAFWKNESRAWSHYYGNIRKVYQILCEEIGTGKDETAKPSNDS